MVATSMVSDLDSVEANNVFIYVADAVRLDYHPDRIAALGTTLETITASIISPSSFASLVTGVYPPRHGVFSFSERLPDDLESLFDLETHDTRFVNNIRFEGEIDPIFNALNLESNSIDDPFINLKEPFAIMERGQGGHTPYGNFEGNTREYFESRGSASTQKISTEYEMGVEADADTFLARLEDLERRGVLDDTLVIYTSDHGELLGEGGVIGHNAPIRPELVRVPTVLIHPTIPSGTYPDALLRQIDIVPTVFDVLGLSDELPQGIDGTSLLGEADDRSAGSFYRFAPELSRLPIRSRAVYESVWDGYGGHVFARSNLPERMMVFAGHLLFGATRKYIRRNLLEGFRSFSTGYRTFGSPEMTRDEAEQHLSQIKRGKGVSGERREISEEAKQHLKNLGYR